MILYCSYRPDPIVQPVKPRQVVQPEDKLKAGMKERLVAAVVNDHEQCEREVEKRLKFEEKIKRTYFHVKPLDVKQLKNWEAYLDFEIAEGDHERILVLFERCLIPTAQYEQFWAKYARYLENYHKKLKKNKGEGGDNGKAVKVNGREAEADGVKESPLTKAKFAFGTGLVTVDEMREKRCTWTLKGWKGKDKDGNEVMMAEEISSTSPSVSKEEKNAEKSIDERKEEGKEESSALQSVDDSKEKEDVDKVEGEKNEASEETEVLASDKEATSKEEKSKLAAVDGSCPQDDGDPPSTQAEAPVEAAASNEGGKAADKDGDPPSTQAEAPVEAVASSEGGKAAEKEQGDDSQEAPDATGGPDGQQQGVQQETIDSEMKSVLKTPADVRGREAVRDVYWRACKVHCTKKAAIKLKWAAFEEESGETVAARNVLYELRDQYPLLLECWLQIIDLERRDGHMDNADALYKELLKKIPENRLSVSTWVALKHARFQFKVRRMPKEAMASLQAAIKREAKKGKADPRLFSQVVDFSYQMFPTEVNARGVVKAIDFALKSPHLKNIHKLDFVKRKVEFLQEYGTVAKYRDACDEIQVFRGLCAADLKAEAKRKKELEREEQKLRELEALKARVRADANMKAKIAQEEGRLMCTSCHTAMYPDESGAYEFERGYSGSTRARAGQEGLVAASTSGAEAAAMEVDENGIVDLMDWNISEDQEEEIRRKLEEKTKYKEVAPTWELNMETYGYGKRRKVYDPDYEHVESAKFKEYERLETQGYDETIKDADHDKLRNINAPGLGSQPGQRSKPPDKVYEVGDYVVPPRVPQLQVPGGAHADTRGDHGRAPGEQTNLRWKPDDA
jgi:tetratricopeptide (TPR) repeat protein